MKYTSNDCVKCRQKGIAIVTYRYVMKIQKMIQVEQGKPAYRNLRSKDTKTQCQIFK